MKRKSIREHISNKRARREEKQNKKRSREDHNAEIERASKIPNTTSTACELYEKYTLLRTEHNQLFLEAEFLRKENSKYTKKVAQQNELIIRGALKIRELEALITMREVTLDTSSDYPYHIMSH